MIKRTTLLSTLTLLSFGLFYNFSGGPAGGTLPNGSIRMEDRTGSPHATQGTNCSTCHNNGNFDTDVTVELLRDGEVVNAYQPGIAHKIRYTINTTTGGTPNAYGWQSVVLDANDNNSGTFANEPTGSRIAPIDSRSYFEHTGPSSSNTVEVDWTAPEAGLGSVTVYTGAVALDGNGNTNGDNGVAVQTTFEELTVSTNTVNTLPISFAVLGNPVQEELNVVITSEKAFDAEMALINTNGQVLMQKGISLTNGQYTINENVSHLSSGVYYLQLFTGTQSSVQQIIVE